MTQADPISCPHCGQTYALQPGQRAQYDGSTINCTKCGKPFVVPPSMGQSQSPPPLQPGVVPAVPYGGYAQVAPSIGNGLAVTSLVFGIIGFCLPIIGGLVAIVTGILGLSRTKDPRVGGRGLAIAGLVLGCVSIVVSLIVVPLQISILLPALNRAREQANRVKCASNMRQLGLALELYANSNGGNFPDKLEDVLQADHSLLPAVFVCPSDDKTPSTGTSQQSIAADIAGGKHSSYIYVGRGLTTSEPSDTVLLYEPLGDHNNEGMNVLYADGHVAFVRKNLAQPILAQQAAGIRPIKHKDSSGP